MDAPAADLASAMLGKDRRCQQRSTAKLLWGPLLRQLVIVRPRPGCMHRAPLVDRSQHHISDLRMTKIRGGPVESQGPDRCSNASQQIVRGLQACRVTGNAWCVPL